MIKENVSVGKAYPYGAYVFEKGMQFCVACPKDRKLVLRIYDSQGTNPISGATLYIDGAEVKNGISVSSSGNATVSYTLKGTESSIKVLVTDNAGYTATSELTLTPTNDNSNNNNTSNTNSSP